MSLKACAEPGCPSLLPRGVSRCQQHERTKDRAIKHRDSDRRRIYNSRRWQGLRRTVLREQPWCAEPGCYRPSAEVDHIIPARDSDDPYDRANLQGLCKPHHSAKTAKEMATR